jgi:hypothetical protein
VKYHRRVHSPSFAFGARRAPRRTDAATAAAAAAALTAELGELTDVGIAVVGVVLLSLGIEEVMDGAEDDEEVDEDNDNGGGNG